MIRLLPRWQSAAPVLGKELHPLTWDGHERLPCSGTGVWGTPEVTCERFVPWLHLILKGDQDPRESQRNCSRTDRAGRLRLRAAAGMVWGKSGAAKGHRSPSLWDLHCSPGLRPHRRTKGALSRGLESQHPLSWVPRRTGDAAFRRKFPSGQKYREPSDRNQYVL